MDGRGVFLLGILNCIAQKRNGLNRRFFSIAHNKKCLLGTYCLTCDQTWSLKGTKSKCLGNTKMEWVKLKPGYSLQVRLQADGGLTRGLKARPIWPPLLEVGFLSHGRRRPFFLYMICSIRVGCSGCVMFDQARRILKRRRMGSLTEEQNRRQTVKSRRRLYSN